jgi:6-pyruvoyltetrahydropterin/6-carboxytetrahydropterin synthase
MFTDRVEVTFEAGHRLLFYKGKCESPHGHTFKVEIMVSSGDLDDLGFVVDFVELKNKVGGWIDENWDHAFLVNGQDQELRRALDSLTDKKVFVFEDGNPSAENMARYFYNMVSEWYGKLVSKVRVWESPSDYAEYFERSAK